MPRPIHTLGYALGFFFIVVLSSAKASSENTRNRFSKNLSAEEGQRFLERFRAQRLQGDYCFKFLLEHLPRRGRTVRYQGTLWGSWNEAGPVSRISLNPVASLGEASTVPPLEWVVQNGQNPQVWARQGNSPAFTPLGDAALMEPLFQGVLYRPFDLLMPFIYWEDYQCEGIKTIGTRIVQQFLMQPPSEVAFPGLSAVRLALDSQYQALLRIEILNTEDKAITRFDVESFKKVQEQYIVKRITLGDRLSGERTRFKVIAAAVGLELPLSTFDAQNFSEAPQIPSEQFTDL